MLEVTSLVKEYRSGKGWHRAVDNLTFTVNPGEIVGILGPNGAGKTTALRCIAGILQPSYGSIQINGADLATQPAAAKQAMAYVPEVPSLYELLTVEEHLRFVAMCYGTLDEYEARATGLLEKYDLAPKRKELVATLSKGMRQKLTVACAMIHRAKLFLFDEPLIGIDPAGVAEIKSEMSEQRAQGAAILVSTHLLDTAERLCDRVLIVALGRKLFEGNIQELRVVMQDQDASLEDLFLRLTRGEAHAAPAVSHD